jgi:hypothetical protein
VGIATWPLAEWRDLHESGSAWKRETYKPPNIAFVGAIEYGRILTEYRCANCARQTVAAEAPCCDLKSDQPS